PAAAPPRLPGRLAIAAEGNRARDVTAEAARMLQQAAWERAGSRPVMPTRAPSAASPMAVALPMPAGISGDQNGLPGHERSVSQGSVRPGSRPKAVTDPAR